MMGYLNTMYLYTRHQFGWNLANYTQYSVADSFIAITGNDFLRSFKLHKITHDMSLFFRDLYHGDDNYANI